MSMFLLSEKLLENELKNKPEVLDAQQEFYYSMVEKELYVIQRLNIEMCDMRGEEKEVADRLEKSEVAILPHDVLEEMRKSVEFKNFIVNAVETYLKGEW